jgi:hypothetical protein
MVHTNFSARPAGVDAAARSRPESRLGGRFLRGRRARARAGDERLNAPALGQLAFTVLLKSCFIAVA